MKIAAALLAAVVLLAGCSGSSDDAPTPEKTSADPSRQLDRDSVAEQAEAQTERQAEQQKAAMKNLEEAVAAEAADVKIVIKDGKVSPRGDRFEAKVGQEITLSVTSDAADEIHVHSDPEHTFEVEPGKAQVFSFTIDTPGQVAVEAHHAGATIVQLVVRP